LIVTSGAGLSVDSGLSDFRGSNGMYTWLKELEPDLEYYEIMNPNYFE
jgi:NAD-dependent SIR2 family protein deacetylase